MRIAIYGGSFNPPHRGHRSAALSAVKALKPDRFLIVPDAHPPHKTLDQASPAPETRLELCRLNFRELDCAEVSDMELRRGGTSYTADTIRELLEKIPGAELTLVMGTDMLLSLDTWRESEMILRSAAICALAREKGERERLKKKALELRFRYGANVRIINAAPFPAASANIRTLLRERGGNALLTEEVYAEIVRRRLYDVKVNFPWLRRKAYAMLKPSRVAHVRGCEQEARRLALRWGEDPDKAAEAAILHDCTKKEALSEQLRLCQRYGILPDEMELRNGKTLHAKTGAAVAEQVFGMDAAVCSAIRWHTTGKPDMCRLDKILYLADYIEPSREFDGIKALRKLAYEDLDAAVLRGLEMSRAHVSAKGEALHVNTLTAIRWLEQERERSGPDRKGTGS